MHIHGFRWSWRIEDVLSDKATFHLVSCPCSAVDSLGHVVRVIWTGVAYGSECWFGRLWLTFSPVVNRPHRYWYGFHVLLMAAQWRFFNKNISVLQADNKPLNRLNPPAILLVEVIFLKMLFLIKWVWVSVWVHVSAIAHRGQRRASYRSELEWLLATWHGR